MFGVLTVRFVVFVFRILPMTFMFPFMVTLAFMLACVSMISLAFTFVRVGPTAFGMFLLEMLSQFEQHAFGLTAFAELTNAICQRQGIFSTFPIFRAFGKLSLQLFREFPLAIRQDFRNAATGLRFLSYLLDKTALLSVIFSSFGRFSFLKFDPPNRPWALPHDESVELLRHRLVFSASQLLGNFQGTFLQLCCAIRLSTSMEICNQSV
jgi:hypothetical protein